MITLAKIDNTTLDFVQYRVAGDQSTFVGPASSDSHIENLLIKSTAPKRGNNQYGNRRSSVNLIRTSSVLDLEGSTVSRSRKLAIDSSLPVGTTEADVFEDFAQLGKLMQDESFVRKVFLQGIIEH
jgi:hypothetical protein